MAPKAKVQSKKHIARLERERRQVRLIKIIAVVIVAAVVLIIGYGLLDQYYLQPLQPVAEVNGEKITTKEFQARVVLQRNDLLNQYMLYQQYQQFGMDVSNQLSQVELSLNTPSVVGQQVMDYMIGEALIRQEAERRGITVSEAELEKFTQSQFQFFPDGSPTPTITPTAVDITYPTLSPEQLELVTVTPVPTEGPTVTPPPTPTLDPESTPEATPTTAPTPLPTATATPYTLEGYQSRLDDVIANMKEIGLTESQYRRLFETGLLRQKLIEEVTTDLPKEEEQVWARHILVPDIETANEVIQRLNNGEDFGELARELSEDSGSAANGGDLGWFGKGQMVPEFEQAAFNLEVGEISEPIESQFGFHIIQTLGKTTVPLSADALDQARQTEFENYIDQLREEADITIYDYWVDRVPTSPNLQELQQGQVQ
ncbi:MAG: peptidylprolyl isomerase [Anaerolineales bacterium]|jgi:parvulin-like peptidyl-prolyl isomerase